MIQTAIKKEDFDKHKANPDESVKTYPASKSIGLKGLVCPDCGADIYAKSNHLGTCFYVLNKGGKHTEPNCITLSSAHDKTIKSYTHEKFNSKTFLDGIIPEEPLPKNVKGPKEKKPGPEGGEHPPDIDPEEIESRPSSKISDIIAEKLHKEDPQLIIDNEGTKLKDILLAVPSFRNDFFINPNQLSFTRRIIQMKPYNSFSNNKYYIGRIFKYIGRDKETQKKIYTYIYFKINIRDSRKPFYKYYQKTFRREADNNGIMINVSNYENIFVAGYWEPTEPYRTKKGEEYPMFETTVYDFGKQIYHHNRI